MMFRAGKSVLNSLKFQKKHFVRYFAAEPVLPEFADVVIIGERCGNDKTNGRSNLLEVMLAKLLQEELLKVVECLKISFVFALQGISKSVC